MKVLVAGAAGMLGHQVLLSCRKSFGIENVWGTLRKPRSNYRNFEIFQEGPIYDCLDVSNFSNVESVLDKVKPDVIINCIGLTLRKKDISDFQKALEINGMLPHRLALWGKSNSCRLIHFSTDCVFDGKRGSYSENDIPTAEDVYGQTKYLGEVVGDNALTLRLSIVGRELEGKTELLEWFLSNKGNAVQGYSRFKYSGLTTGFVAKEVVRVIRNYPLLHGLYQVSSEPLTKYEILKIANEVFETRADIIPNDQYQADKTLLSDRYQKATGFKKPTWVSMLKETADDLSVDYGV